jgi:chorismate mutase/prephenate dehydratase
MNIDKIREDIDKIDQEILELLAKRANLALEVKKTSGGKSRIRPERENEILRKLIEQDAGPLPKKAVKEIFTQIISSFRNEMQLDRPISVSYLGPEGTYSEQAAVDLFGKSTNLYPENNIPDVFRSVEAGNTDLAVVPIENTTEGAVRETHSLLFDTNAKICAEINIPIIHSLITTAENISEISSVYAHPQALAQCSTWLKTHLPKAEQISVESNAKAAALAKDQTGSSAVASDRAAEIYGLNVLERGINDRPDNKTRFIALGTIHTRPTGNDKTSLICVLNDKPGALYEILGFFAKENISMTRLESQAYKTGQYAFHIDFIGHIQEKSVAEVIENIEKNTKICRILGSYPIEAGS